MQLLTHQSETFGGSRLHVEVLVVVGTVLLFSFLYKVLQAPQHLRLRAYIDGESIVEASQMSFCAKKINADAHKKFLREKSNPKKINCRPRYHKNDTLALDRLMAIIMAMIN